MSPELWQKIEEIFQAAVDLDPEDRSRYVADASAGDAELQRQIEGLLRQYDQATALIEEPAYTRTTVYEIASMLDDSDPMVGHRIGAYEVVREIGRGGMGAVYLAARADKAFQKHVAIKLVKRGMDTDFILRRFRRERQILAALDHPNIARLLDGGTTEDGRPYFVMDYIVGQPIYPHCDARRLSVNERLQIFCRICEAVDYAHKNLIIHRDIKPSNILVTADGTPKLLDFGIAKLLNPELESDTAPITAMTTRMMTVEYASPEQVSGEAVTFLSDVYSLGVMLYELLSGHRPYHFRNRWPHDMARVIVEEEPEQPSLAVVRPERLMATYQIDAGSGALEHLSEARGETLDGLQKKLSGALDNIILKAMCKDLPQRYQSVALLREDILRYLEGRPVSGPFHPAAPRATRAPDAVERADEKTIAVLPLKLLNVNTNEETDDKYLSVGLADAMITRLSNVQSLTVRPTSSILRYIDADPVAAGQELRVEFVLDGRIRRAGGRIRVSLQLLDVGGGSTVWANQFDETLTNVLELEDSISEQIARALLPQLTEDERRQLKKRGTENPEAFEAYLRGRYYWSTFTEEGFAKALVRYHSAVALDPGYGLAYAGIADYYIWLGIFGAVPFSEASAAAKEAALKAIALDDTLAEAYAALGTATLLHDFNWRLAEQQHRRALELNPNYATGHLWYGFQLSMMGRFDEAVLAMRRAIELDPISPINYYSLGWAYISARRFEEGIAVARRLVADEPHYGLGHLLLSLGLKHAGRHEEAIEEGLKFFELSGRNPGWLPWIAVAYAAAGETARARELLKEAEEVSLTRHVPAYVIALVYSELGETERALTLLERGLAERDGWLAWLGVAPQFDPLRHHPRFEALLRATNNPAAAQHAARGSESTGEKAIAVLPFKLLGSRKIENTDDEFLSTGLADALIMRLSQVRRFIVRPTSSVLRYAQTGMDPLAAGRELRVDYVVDGNIRRAGNTLRVTVQLLHVSEGATRWAGRFDEEFTDVLELEDSISEQVASALVPQLTGDERRRLQKRGTENPDAFEAYLRGRYYWNKFTPEFLPKALESFQTSVALDPDYALAHVGVADFYNWACIYGIMPARDCYPRAKAAALRALELDESLGEAYAALGLTLESSEWDWEEAERLYLRALDLNPNYSLAHEWYSSLLVGTGRFEEGVKEIRRAEELDPHSLRSMTLTCWTCYQARYFNEVISKANQIVDFDRNYPQGYLQLGNVLELVGRTEEAIAALRESERLMPDSVLPKYVLCFALVAAGRGGEARQVLDEIKEIAATQYVKPYFVALAHVALGERDTAFELFEVAFRERDPWLIWFGTEPKLDPLHKDPRFIDLYRRMNNPLLLR
ncbi:MAG TPA: protein kinase [Blastocatellia bacterium]|nr:protein kinase [Blastocatellia bacterium]